MQGIAAPSSVADNPRHGHAASQRKGDILRLALGAVGLVHGDIGTSPLYAIKECVTLPYGVAPATASILGVLSLVFWSLTLVVSIKYVAFEADTSFYLGRETLPSLDGKGMATWRKWLFRFLSRNLRAATDFFALPANRVVESGAQIEL